MKYKILLVLLLAFSVKAVAYDYSEHKDIGDAAWLRLMGAIQKSENGAFLLQFLNVAKDEKTNSYYFVDLSVAGGEDVGYGVLNGLSGDHARTALQLEEQLRRKNTLMQQVIYTHNKYMEQGYTSAPNGKIAFKDFSYIMLAAISQAHFYEYGKTFQQQFRKFDKSYIKQCQNPREVETIFKKLEKTNSLDFYVTLHALSIDLAEQAGKLVRTNPEQAKQLLFYAFLFNGFADHFLEDSFVSGHLVVNRSLVASLTNNNALHNFYNAEGVTVVNREGEIWRASGDKFFNSTQKSWQKDTSLLAIHYSPYTQEANRTIHAVELSLTDVWSAFEQSYTNEDHVPFYNQIPDEKEKQPDYLIANIPALKLVPIPFNSDLTTLFPDTVKITDPMQKAGQLVYYRNFVMSRTANTLVLGLNAPPVFWANDVYFGMEFRLNIGNPISVYSLNKYGGKRGTVDYWMGYTFMYGFGKYYDYDQENKMGDPLDVDEDDPDADLVYEDYDDFSTLAVSNQIRVGVRNNVDIWVAEKRFIGLSNYTEVGVQWTKGKAAFVFVPSFGVQIGSLFNINYYNMPAWARLPLQLIIPLKVKYGVIISPGQEPNYFMGVDLDILF